MYFWSLCVILQFLFYLLDKMFVLNEIIREGSLQTGNQEEFFLMMPVPDAHFSKLMQLYGSRISALVLMGILANSVPSGTFAFLSYHHCISIYIVICWTYFRLIKKAFDNNELLHKSPVQYLGLQVNDQAIVNCQCHSTFNILASVISNRLWGPPGERSRVLFLQREAYSGDEWGGTS